MRISDWNSDVCSSDLKYQRASAAVDIFAHAVGERQARRVVHGIAGHRRLNLVIDVADQDQFIDALADTNGRAWCMERVCDYVWISVVAVSLKTQHDSRDNQC